MYVCMYILDYLNFTYEYIGYYGFLSPLAALKKSRYFIIVMTANKERK